jgi:hypothetical protein
VASRAVLSSTELVSDERTEGDTGKALSQEFDLFYDRCKHHAEVGVDCIE